MIEQAVITSLGLNGFGFQARSHGFQENWLEEAQRLCEVFGHPPSTSACPLSLFVQPFLKNQIAVVRAADEKSVGRGQTGSFVFHFLVLPRKAYQFLGSDPFYLADRFPPVWQDGFELPALDYPEAPPWSRSLAQIQNVLQRSDGPNLLGGTQALLDGGRLAFCRPAPDWNLIRSFWQLLPYSTRARVWPATYCFNKKSDFHILISPFEGAPSGYLVEDLMADYPEGRYEKALQTAAEAGDVKELARLFERKDRHEVMLLGFLILALVIVLALVSKI